MANSSTNESNLPAFNLTSTFFKHRKNRSSRTSTTCTTSSSTPQFAQLSVRHTHFLIKKLFSPEAQCHICTLLPTFICHTILSTCSNCWSTRTWATSNTSFGPEWSQQYIVPTKTVNMSLPNLPTQISSNKFHRLFDYTEVSQNTFFTHQSQHTRSHSTLWHTNTSNTKEGYPTQLNMNFMTYLSDHSNF